MMLINDILFFVLTQFFIHSLNTQSVTPFYGTSQYFYSNTAQINYVFPKPANAYTYDIPSTFPISTASHREPFYGISAFSNFRMQNNTKLPFLTQLLIYTPTTFRIRVYSMVTNDTFGTITEINGFLNLSKISFRYLLVKNTFPDSYICKTIVIPTPFTMNTNIMYTYLVSTSSLINTTSLILSANNTIFVHCITYLQLISDNLTKDSSFGLIISFQVIDSSNFNINIFPKYPITAITFQIKLFLYDKSIFSSYYIQYELQQLQYDNLGFSANINRLLNTILEVTVGDVFFGLSAFQFQGYSDIGFNTSINSFSTNDITISLTNLLSNSSVPRLKFTFFFLSQFQCPNGQLLINQLLNNCYNVSCPSNTYLTNQQVGITGIFICKSCKIHDLNCNLCNQTICIGCQPGYQINSSNACAPLPSSIQKISLKQSKIKDKNTILHKIYFGNGLGLNNTQSDLINDLQIQYKLNNGVMYTYLLNILSVKINPDRFYVEVQTNNIFGDGNIDFQNSYFQLNYSSTITDQNNLNYVSTASFYPLLGRAFLQSYYNSQKNDNLLLLGNILCIITFVLLMVTLYIKIKDNSSKQYHEVMSFVMTIYCVGFIRLRIYKFPLLEVIQILTGFSYFQINFAQNIFNPQYHKLKNPQTSYLPIALTYENQSFLSTAGNSLITFLFVQTLLLVYFIKIYFTNKEYSIFNKSQQLVLAFFMVKFLFASLLDYGSLNFNKISDYQGFQSLYVMSLLLSLFFTIFYLVYLYTRRDNIKEQLYKYQNLIRIIAILAIIIDKFGGLISLNIVQIVFLGLNIYFYRNNKINVYLHITESIGIICSFIIACVVQGSLILIIVLALILYGIWGIKLYYVLKYFRQQNKIINQKLEINQTIIEPQKDIKVKKRPKILITQEEAEKQKYAYQQDLKSNRLSGNRTRRPVSALTIDQRNVVSPLNFSSQTLNQNINLNSIQLQNISDGIESINLQPQVKSFRKQAIMIQNEINILQNKQKSPQIQNVLKRRKMKAKRKQIIVTKQQIQ